MSPPRHHEEYAPTPMDIAKLALENGTVFTGKAFGATGETDGEVVFNTSMTGYQEILTDPSYHGQIVAMTSPMVGNYGVNAEDAETGHEPVVDRLPRGGPLIKFAGHCGNREAGGHLFVVSSGVIGVGCTCRSGGAGA